MASELGLNARVTVGAGHDSLSQDSLNQDSVLDQDSVDLAANPITLSDTPVSYRRRPPRLGQHADEVRAWLNNLPETESPQHHSSNNNNQPLGAHQ
jgi:crotonobetainyl-CoA:carnitine CoA-transferase CaiB-like acyl-CoA transferase